MSNSEDEFFVFQANGLGIVCRKDEDGGGADFGQEYIEIVRQRYGPQSKVYEFCSGPSFIGFSIYGAGLIKKN